MVVFSITSLKLEEYYSHLIPLEQSLEHQRSNTGTHSSLRSESMRCLERVEEVSKSLLREERRVRDELRSLGTSTEKKSRNRARKRIRDQMMKIRA